MSLLCCWAGGPWIISRFAARASHWLSLWSQWKSLLHREDAAVFLTLTQKPAEPPPVSWLTPSRLHRLPQLSEHCNIHTAADVYLEATMFIFYCLHLQFVMNAFFLRLCTCLPSRLPVPELLPRRRTPETSQRSSSWGQTAQGNMTHWDSRESVMLSNWETEKVTRSRVTEAEKNPSSPSGALLVRQLIYVMCCKTPPPFLRWQTWTFRWRWMHRCLG